MKRVVFTFGFYSFCRRFFVPALGALAVSACGSLESANYTPSEAPKFSDLSIEALRSRGYSSEIKIVESIGDKCARLEGKSKGSGDYTSYMAGYNSDGLNLYTRIDIPDGPAPVLGFPVIVFAHGWVGIEDAPTYHFGCSDKSMYRAAVDTFARAGFVVLSPGYRGHGTVGSVPADGIEDMRRWDNGSYLSPVFYAVDVMNLMSGIPGLEDLDMGDVKIDESRLYLSGHSQGGDVALTVLAAIGEGAASGLKVTAASIWAGNIADKFTQLETFAPLQVTSESFVSGDGSWTGTAIGKDGNVNPNFVFGYPPDWIETPDKAEWTWQLKKFSVPTVKAATEEKYSQMYGVINAQIKGVEDATFQTRQTPDGVRTTHDPRVLTGMNNIGGFEKPEYLTEPLNLHFSDRDFYSLPVWNTDICTRIKKLGGRCTPYEYVGNTHGFKVSEHSWFSPPGTVAGYDTILSRDLALFSEP